MIDTGYYESPSVSGGKYWRYHYDTSTGTLTVSWGRLGATPQMRRKPATQAEVDKLVRSKLIKGYYGATDPLGKTELAEWKCERCGRFLSTDTLRIWRLGSASGVVCAMDTPKVDEVVILTYDEAMNQAAAALDEFDLEDL